MFSHEARINSASSDKCVPGYLAANGANLKINASIPMPLPIHLPLMDTSLQSAFTILYGCQYHVYSLPQTSQNHSHLSTLLTCCCLPDRSFLHQHYQCDLSQRIMYRCNIFTQYFPLFLKQFNLSDLIQVVLIVIKAIL